MLECAPIQEDGPNDEAPVVLQLWARDLEGCSWSSLSEIILSNLEQTVTQAPGNVKN